MADDDPGEDGDERTIELSALAAIYPELVIQSDDGANDDVKRASLSIQVDPLVALSIYTPKLADGAGSIANGASHEGHRDGCQERYRPSHLPPLNVDIAVPQDYPAQKPPAVHLSTQESWLAKEKLQELEDSVRTLWEDVGRDQVLYAYIDHLREAAEMAFGLGPVLLVSPELKLALLDFDLKTKRAKFERITFDCGVCLGRLHAVAPVEYD